MCEGPSVVSAGGACNGEGGDESGVESFRRD